MKSKCGANKNIYFDRHQAFLPGQKYDFRLLQLTANRMMLDEYYADEPRADFLSSFNVRSFYKGLGTEQTYHQFQIQHQSLWNWMDWEPPLAIIGWRIKAGSFLIEDDSTFF